MRTAPVRPILDLTLARLVIGVAAGALLLGCPAAAGAQGRWVFTPSLILAERYDDNVFGTAHDRQSDFITRITPGVALGYEGETVSLGASFSATGELYADQSDLDNFGENRNGALTLGYRPDERLTLRLAGRYARTNDPSEFVATESAPVAAALGAPVVPTVELQRRESSQFTLGASGDYRLDPRWTARAGYEFAYVDEEAGTDSRSHTGRVGARYDLSRSDQVFSDASASAFEGGDPDTSASLLLGWARRWTQDFRTSLALGPRVSDGDWGAAADASLTYLPEREWSVTLAYFLGTGLAVGEEGAQNVSTLRASVGFQPMRDLRFSAGSSWTRTWDIGNDPDEEVTTTYGATLSASYRITDWLIATLAYQLSYERPAAGDTITHNQVTLGLTLAYPFRF
jgi:hypothetical protein